MDNIKEFHLHYGAGKLSIGLLLPSFIKSGIIHGVIQRPSNDFDTIIFPNSPRFIYLNDIKYRIITNLSDLNISNQDFNSENLFIYTNSDTELFNYMNSVATSISTSIGPDFKYFKNINFRQSINIFAAENNFNDINELSIKLKNKCNVFQCMIDRICTDRSIFRSNLNQNIVFVRTESFKGEIILPKSIKKIPFSGENVHRCKSDLEFNYLYKRKMIFVNGIHTNIAFIILSKIKEKIIIQEDRLQKPFSQISLKLDEDELYILKIWITARKLFLLDLFDVKKVYECEDESNLIDILFEYSNNCLNRILDTPDNLGRILGGGVVRRYSERIKPIINFINELPNYNLNNTQMLVLNKSNLKFEQLYQIINNFSVPCLDI